ncbi:methionyl-tRNA formyltransferase [Solicola gregarius]|uniref:Methionyl-tRNA formyltransferase n=1 Tax=Solicola gregarius TaxID=2908642 RepID=A0AA46TI19_9ACTN|nr:methionyl-tRNA formyltransferase [Solicola gregarius]UYM05239.1 methionyl-tRNA formyltransferase [Solicola gregarius]
MRVVFAGTPDVALPSLDAIASSHHELVAVVTRPDAPTGRGRKLVASPVSDWAAERGIETLKPERAGDPAFLDRLRELSPACCPVVAYGALLPQSALDVPEHGWVNLHFSVLPAWRGAAPVQHALLAGDEVTGATTFRIVKELDAGPVYGVLTEAVRPDDTSGALLDRLAAAGSTLLVDTLDHVEAGDIEARPQSADGASYATKIEVDDGRVRWTEAAAAIDRRIRACTPDPGAWTTLDGGRIKLGPVQPTDGDTLEPGEISADKHTVRIGTATVDVELGSIQPRGKRPMPAADWARGVRPEAGARFDAEG